jgi:hypothetical protein
MRAVNLPLEGRSKFAPANFGRGSGGGGGVHPLPKSAALPLADFDLPSRGRFDRGSMAPSSP